MSKTNPVFEIVTDQIIALLEKGVAPWSKTWGDFGAPKNAATGWEYHGINSLLLNCTEHAAPWFMSYKQAQSLGGQVRKGEKGFTATFWKLLKTGSKETADEATFPILRYYTVFNVSQIDGLPERFLPTAKERNNHPIETAVSVVDSMKNRPTITHAENKAFYRRSTDTVNMPSIGMFKNAEAYHSIMFHELTHSTGHASRLDRHHGEETSPFGSPTYSKEELVAEMGASFLCGHCGILESTVETSAAYIQNWMTALRNDKKMVVMAASAAQKAVNHILGIEREA